MTPRRQAQSLSLPGETKRIGVQYLHLKSKVNFLFLSSWSVITVVTGFVLSIIVCSTAGHLLPPKLKHNYHSVPYLRILPRNRLVAWPYGRMTVCLAHHSPYYTTCTLYAQSQLTRQTYIVFTNGYSSRTSGTD